MVSVWWSAALACIHPRQSTLRYSLRHASKSRSRAEGWPATSRGQAICARLTPMSSFAFLRATILAKPLEPRPSLPRAPGFPHRACGGDLGDGLGLRVVAQANGHSRRRYAAQTIVTWCCKTPKWSRLLWVDSVADLRARPEISESRGCRDRSETSPPGAARGSAAAVSVISGWALSLASPIAWSLNPLARPGTYRSRHSTRS